MILTLLACLVVVVVVCSSKTSLFFTKNSIVLVCVCVWAESIQVITFFWFVCLL